MVRHVNYYHPNTVSEFVPMLLAATGDDSKRQKRLDHGKEGNLMMYLACVYITS